jgi:hypothetical protein
MNLLNSTGFLETELYTGFIGSYCTFLSLFIRNGNLYSSGQQKILRRAPDK